MHSARPSPPRLSSRRLTIPCRLAAIVWLAGAMWGAGLPAETGVEHPAGAGHGAETVPVRHLDVEDGLSHSVIYSMLRDRHGFVWIGTEDGLDRFDGQSFEHVHHADASQAGTHWDTSALVEDADGTLWIGTWGGGLKRFDPSTGLIEVFRHDPQDPASVLDDRVQTLHLDAEGNLWLGTYDGLQRMQADDGAMAAGVPRFVHYPRAEGLAERVWAITPAADGGLWIGTDEGLDLLDPSAIADPHAPRAGEGRRVTYVHDRADPASLVHSLVRTMLLDAGGRLWVGTDDGLDVLPPLPSRDLADARFEHVETLPDGELEAVIINSLLASGDGTIWVGSNDMGLLRIDPDSRQVVEHLPFDPDGGRHGLPHADVRSLLYDDQGLLWVGTRGGGVQILDRSPRAARPVDLGVRADELDNPRELLVTDVLIDSDGRLWAGTDLGLVRVEATATGHHIRRFRQSPDDPHSLVSNNVSELHLSTDGTLWVGTFGGLARYRPAAGAQPEGFLRVPLQVGTSAILNPLEERIEALAEAPDGDLWIGSRAGLARLDPDTGAVRLWSPATSQPPSLSDDYVRDLEPAADGTLWIGTDAGGLDHFDPATGRFRNFRHDPDDPFSLSHDRVFSIKSDPSGDLWLATAFGINRFDPATGRALRFSTDDGLPSATVKCLLLDHEGAVWTSSNGGVSRLLHLFDDSSGGTSLRNYGRSDGLGGLLFVEDSCTAGMWGERGYGLFFGGRHGLEQIDPDVSAETLPGVPLVLTATTVAGRNVGSGPGGAARPSLDLGWDHRAFGFEYAALDYRAPQQVRYAYRLENFDGEWLESTRRYVSYTNVPPGEYVFRVRATDSRGRSAARELAIPVRVTPPFWMTLWFRLVGLLLLVGLLTTGYKLRTRHLKRQRSLLEQQVREQTEVLRRQRRRLEIIDHIVQLINEESDFVEVLRSILEGISFAQAADRALALVRRREADPRGELRGAGSFEIGADFGWSDTVPALVPLDRQDIEDRYLAAAAELADGIWLGAPSPSALLASETAVGEPPRRVLAMRVELDAETAGYLLFSKLSDDEAFSHVNVNELVNLKDHVESAFRKAAMLDELRWLNAKKSEFLGIAAHDLRSPLGSIQSYADLLLRWLDQQRFDEQRWKRFLGHVRSAAAHMLALLNDLLDVTAIETGRLVLSRESVDVADLLEERHQLQGRLAHDKGIDWRLDLDGARGVSVTADRIHTAEVVDNLLSNALKFTEPGGRVTLRCEVEERRVRVEVEDNGQGLDPDELGAVFTGRKLSARPTGGEASSGFGLVIVKKIVEMQTGEVWVESERHKGSTFGFSLPREMSE